MAYVTTRYRAYLIQGDTRTALVGTTERKTKRALQLLIGANKAAVLTVLSEADLDATMIYKNGVFSMGSTLFILECV